MIKPLPHCILLFCASIFLEPPPAKAQHIDFRDQIGVTLLETLATNVNGSGIRVGQPEAPLATGVFEADDAQLGLPGRFSYFSMSGSANFYPNTVGTNSWHAERVGTNFYSPGYGVATNVAHVDNYEANDFYTSVIAPFSASNINDPVINQSFVFGDGSGPIPVNQQQQVDASYDNYAARCNALFVSGAGNYNGQITAPGTCYNGIAVGVTDGTSSHGPTPDNNRSKPDITAPGQGVTSFSTPYVSGTAAALAQAALRGDGGSDTNSASDMRTLKALLLNGAIKPAGWTNSPGAPLDIHYGAGVLNAFNSYEELAFGKHAYLFSTSVTNGAPHPPTGAVGTIGANSGWDFNSITSVSGNPSPPAMDGVNHYYFNVSNGVCTVTVTLVWNRQFNQANINNLSLFLYNTANSNLVMQSTSAVDNVQHFFTNGLPSGRYDLQVWKAGGPGIVSASESYALAWAVTAPALKIKSVGGNAIFSWPVYPAGYALEATPTLLSPSWSSNGVPGPVFLSGTNIVTLPMTNGMEFFRLQQPGS